MLMTTDMKSWTTRLSSQQRPGVALHYWGRRGGGSQFTLFLARHLTGAANPPEVLLSLARTNDDMEAFQASGLPIIQFDRPTLSTLWREGWSLPAQLRTHAATLASLNVGVVIMTMNSPFAWPFIHALQRRGIRVIYVAHDAEPHPGDYAITWQRTTQDLLVRNADRVVALSSSVAERMAERVPAAAMKTSVIPLEVVFPTHRTLLPARASADEPFRLLFYGRLLPYKGLDTLAAVLEPLRANPLWRLTIAGSGPLELEVRRIFGAWPQVHLELGWVSEQRMAELFSSHHLLLCPYMEASQSGAVAQALSWAMPSLVMPTGALPGQVGFGIGGLVAATMDPGGFRQVLQSVLEHPGRLEELSRGANALLTQRQGNQDWMKLVEAAALA